VGRPDKEAREEVERLRDYLEERMEEAADVPVRGAIVFVNEEVQLEADQSPVPAFYRKKVKDWLRGPGDWRPLSDQLQQRLAEALGVGEEEDDGQPVA
jgi:hypothetical protein